MADVDQDTSNQSHRDENSARIRRTRRCPTCLPRTANDDAGSVASAPRMLNIRWATCCRARGNARRRRPVFMPLSKR